MHIFVYLVAQEKRRESPDSKLVCPAFFPGHRMVIHAYISEIQANAPLYTSVHSPFLLPVDVQDERRSKTQLPGSQKVSVSLKAGKARKVEEAREVAVSVFVEGFGHVLSPIPFRLMIAHKVTSQWNDSLDTLGSTTVH